MPFQKAIWWQAGWLTLAAALLLGAADIFIPGGGTWWGDLYTEESVLTFFCEPAIVQDLIRQKADTYSNLGFWYVGMVMLLHGNRDLRGLQRGPAAEWSLAYGMAAVFMCLASGFFHASLTWVAEWLDLCAVYGMAWLPVCFNLAQLQKNAPHKAGTGMIRPRRWLLVWLLLWGLSSVLIFRVPSHWMVPGTVLLIALTALLLERRAPSGETVYLKIAVLFVGLAIMWFRFDIARIWCDPQSWFQPHAMWHLHAAAAGLAYYAYMRAYARRTAGPPQD